MRPVIAPAPSGPLTPAAEPPTISVLVCAYQAAATIGDTLESLRTQTVPPHEIVVCDDGSTDDLDRALGPFRGDVVLVRQSNRGAASALNAAARAATGEFLAVCDSDDVYLPERVEALGELARIRPDLDILSTDAIFWRDGRELGRFNDANPFPRTGQRAAILERCFMAAPAVRASRFAAVGGANESLRTGYDWDCWMRMIFAGCRAGHVHVPLLEYRLRPESLTHNRVPSLRARLVVLEGARRRGGLTAGERAVLERSWRAHHARWAREAAEARLGGRGGASRRTLVAAAAARGTPWRRRVLYGTAAVAPGAGAGALRRLRTRTPAPSDGRYAAPARDA